MITLGELARRFDLTLSGDAQRPVTGLATLAGAGAGDISFLSNKKYASQLATTRAAAVILHPELVGDCPVYTLATEHPYVAFARMTAVFDRAPRAVAGIHPSAVVSADASVAADVSVGPNAVVEAGAELGAGAVIGANA